MDIVEYNFLPLRRTFFKSVLSSFGITFSKVGGQEALRRYHGVISE